MCITHSHGTARVLKATKQVNGKGQNSSAGPYAYSQEFHSGGQYGGKQRVAEGHEQGWEKFYNFCFEIKLTPSF